MFLQVSRVEIQIGGFPQQLLVLGVELESLCKVTGSHLELLVQLGHHSVDIPAEGALQLREHESLEVRKQKK